MIKMKDCVRRGVYRIRSRNLTIGVYDGDGGFVGVREKFGSRYLFTEYHHDRGAPYGTVRPIMPLDVRLPGWMGVMTHFPLPVTESGKAVYYDGEIDRYVYNDEPWDKDDEKYLHGYRPLYEVLERLLTWDTAHWDHMCSLGEHAGFDVMELKTTDAKPGEFWCWRCKARGIDEDQARKLMSDEEWEQLLSGRKASEWFKTASKDDKDSYLYGDLQGTRPWEAVES